MKSSFWQRHPQLIDIISVIIFVVSVVIGTVLINTFVFQSYTVVGQSMEETLHNGERIIVNRLPITWSRLQNNDYTPERGDIIVFENPNYTAGMKDQYIVKRVIAFSGERVKVEDGVLTVYNDEYPNGFKPDDGFIGWTHWRWALVHWGSLPRRISVRSAVSSADRSSVRIR